MHLQGLGTDPESGVVRIEIKGDVTKVCRLSDDLLQQRRATVLVQQPRGGPLDPPASPLGIGTDVDFNYVSCAGAQATPLSMNGDLHIVVTNFAGGRTTSGSWTFDYIF